MAYNPLNKPSPEKQPALNEQKHTGSANLSNAERNNYGHGLAEDQEVRYLHFRDRRTYQPAYNEPPEEVFQEPTSNQFSSDSNSNSFSSNNNPNTNGDDDIPNFEEPPMEAYLDDSRSISELDTQDLWLDDIPSDALPPSESSNNNKEQNEYNAQVDSESYNRGEDNSQTAQFSQGTTSSESQSQQSVNNTSNIDNPSSSNPNKNDASNNTANTSAKYDYDQLESVPLDFLFSHVGGVAIKGKPGLFSYNEHEFEVRGQSWYNLSFNKGNQGAISLCKELIAIHERIDPFQNNRVLGGKACSYLVGAYKDYFNHYKKTPPVFEKQNNYTTKNDNNSKPDIAKPFSFIEANYSSLSKEDKSTYFTLLDCLDYDSVAKLVNAEKVKNGYVISNPNKESLHITVDDRVWSLPSKVKGQKDKFGIGTLSFVALAQAYQQGLDYFDKEVSKKARLDASKFLGSNITESDIDLKSFELETIIIDKNDPTYLFKMPYHRLSKEEKENYYALIDNIPLDRVAYMLGATENEDGQVGKWKFKETFATDNFHIDLDQNAWKSWNTDAGGFGAMSLVAFYLMCRDGEDFTNKKSRSEYRLIAAKMLVKEMADIDINMESGRRSGLKSEVFTMPYILEAKNPHVKEYLTKKRRLPEWVVQKQMNAGYLFAGYPANWKEIPKLKTPEFMPNDLVWAVFLTVSGQAAEMRGIARSDHYAKILAKGSDKHLGGFLTKAEAKYNEKTVCSFEASIDSLSYHAIYPGRITQSCMGTEYKLAAHAAADTLLYEGTKHSCCFDNDYAGIKATLKYFELLKTLMQDEDLYEEMLVKQKENPDYKVADELLYKDFFEAFNTGRINMFELTIKDLAESLKTGEKFYLDILEDKNGINAAKIFYKLASKSLGKDIVDQAFQSGQFKYMNVLPSLRNLESNMQETVTQTLNKLLSNNNFYLELPDVQSFVDKEQENFHSLNDNEKQEEFSKTKKILAKFVTEFETQAQPHLEKLKKDGKLLYERKTFFKDWNEHLVYMLNTYPEFKKLMEEREKEFSSYSLPSAPKIKPGKNN